MLPQTLNKPADLTTDARIRFPMMTALYVLYYRPRPSIGEVDFTLAVWTILNKSR